MADSSTQPSHPRRSEPISKPAGLHLKKRLRLSHVWGPAHSTTASWRCNFKFHLTTISGVVPVIAQVRARSQLSASKGDLESMHHPRAGYGYSDYQHVGSK